MVKPLSRPVVTPPSETMTGAAFMPGRGMDATHAEGEWPVDSYEEVTGPVVDSGGSHSVSLPQFFTVIEDASNGIRRAIRAVAAPSVNYRMVPQPEGPLEDGMTVRFSGDLAQLESLGLVPKEIIDFLKSDQAKRKGRHFREKDIFTEVRREGSIYLLTTEGSEELKFKDKEKYALQIKQRKDGGIKVGFVTYYSRATGGMFYDDGDGEWDEGKVVEDDGKLLILRFEGNNVAMAVLRQRKDGTVAFMNEGYLAKYDLHYVDSGIEFFAKMVIDGDVPNDREIAAIVERMKDPSLERFNAKVSLFKRTSSGESPLGSVPFVSEDGTKYFTDREGRVFSVMGFLSELRPSVLERINSILNLHSLSGHIYDHITRITDEGLGIFLIETGRRGPAFMIGTDNYLWNDPKVKGYYSSGRRLLSVYSRNRSKYNLYNVVREIGTDTNVRLLELDNGGTVAIRNIYPTKSILEGVYRVAFTDDESRVIKGIEGLGEDIALFKRNDDGSISTVPKGEVFVRMVRGKKKYYVSDIDSIIHPIDRIHGVKGDYFYYVLPLRNVDRKKLRGHFDGSGDAASIVMLKVDTSQGEDIWRIATQEEILSLADSLGLAAPERPNYPLPVGAVFNRQPVSKQIQNGETKVNVLSQDLVIHEADGDAYSFEVSIETDDPAVFERRKETLRTKLMMTPSIVYKDVREFILYEHPRKHYIPNESMGDIEGTWGEFTISLYDVDNIPPDRLFTTPIHEAQHGITNIVPDSRIKAIVALAAGGVVQQERFQELLGWDRYHENSWKELASEGATLFFDPQKVAAFMGGCRFIAGAVSSMWKSFAEYVAEQSR